VSTREWITRRLVVPRSPVVWRREFEREQAEASAQRTCAVGYCDLARRHAAHNRQLLGQVVELRGKLDRAADQIADQIDRGDRLAEHLEHANAGTDRYRDILRRASASSRRGAETGADAPSHAQRIRVVEP
jgi:hypothetical protein